MTPLAVAGWVMWVVAGILLAWEILWVIRDTWRTRHVRAQIRRELEQLDRRRAECADRRELEAIARSHRREWL